MRYEDQTDEGGDQSHRVDDKAEDILGGTKDEEVGGGVGGEQKQQGGQREKRAFLEKKGSDGKRWRILRGAVEKEEEDGEAWNREPGSIECSEVEDGKSLVGSVRVDEASGGGDQGEDEQGEGEQVGRSS